MSELTRISELCACGASFNWTDSGGPFRAKEAAAAFRLNHQHTRLVGRCMESKPAYPLTDHRPCCSLDHGHVGAHHDDESGEDWQRTPIPLTPATEAHDGAGEVEG